MGESNQGAAGEGMTLHCRDGEGVAGQDRGEELLQVTDEGSRLLWLLRNPIEIETRTEELPGRRCYQGSGRWSGLNFVKACPYLVQERGG
jgi:hypothetical protein